MKRILNSKETKKQTRVLYNILVSYCYEKNIIYDENTIDKKSLNTILSRFYTEVRKGNGGMYKQNSFRAIRFALQRKFQEIRGDDFDIINNPEFNSANKNYDAQCVVMKKAGLAKTDHHEPINEEDLKKTVR